MEKTISKTRLLTLLLTTVTVPTVLVGCGTMAKPAAPTANTVEVAPIAKTPSTPTPRPTASATNPKPATAAAIAAEDNSPIISDTAIADATPDTSFDEPAAIVDNSLWTRIRAGLRIPKMDAALTRPHEIWFIENDEFRESMFGRSKMYLYYIVEEVEKRGMPMEVALLPAIESAYKPYAFSRAKASGLWQFIPSTGKLYGLKTNNWYDGRRDVIASTRAALDYLQKLYNDFGDWQLALAAYNAGEGRIGRAIAQNRQKGLPTDFVNLKQLKQETRHYVPKLMAMVNLISNPALYGIELPAIPNEPYFASIETDSQVDLGVIARLTGLEPAELHYINPGYTRWTTHPEGPHHLLVPADKKDALIAGLSTLPENERVKWRHHQVRKGDTLNSIAKRYQVTAEAIKTTNKLAGPLRVGQNLLLPISASAALPKAPVAKPIRAAASGNRPIIHKVSAGETLWSISKRYNVLVQQILEWNLMEPGDVLRYGQKLKIFTTDGPSA